MVLRLAVVVGALVAMAVVSPDTFATTVLSFAAVFTLYAAVRLFTYPGTGVPAHRARMS